MSLPAARFQCQDQTSGIYCVGVSPDWRGERVRVFYDKQEAIAYRNRLFLLGRNPLYFWEM